MTKAFARHGLERRRPHTGPVHRLMRGPDIPAIVGSKSRDEHRPKMPGRPRTLLAIGEVRGAVDSLTRVLGKLHETDTDAVALVGDLGAPWSKPATYRAIFRALGQTGVPSYWVPGRWDGPLREYLSESASMEVAYPLLRSVHGTAARGPDDILFAGMGGDIVDDPQAISGEEVRIRYAGWEVEHRLKFIRDFDGDKKVFLFTSRPAHKGLNKPGSRVLAELINTYRPRVVIVGGSQPMQEMLGTTLIVCPGRAEIGEYAFIELRRRTVSVGRLVDVHQKRLYGFRPRRTHPAAEGQPRIAHVTERLRQVLEEASVARGRARAHGDRATWLPRAELDEQDDAYLLYVELPGVRPEDVNIELVGMELVLDGSIESERARTSYSPPGQQAASFEYRVTFPEPVDVDEIEATLRDGLLLVRAPKVNLESGISST